MEEWKAVPGYEGYYEVSDLGSVRSIPRQVIDSVERIYNFKPRKLKLQNHKGYLRTYLSKCGKVTPFFVHILVWKAFKGEIPDGYQIDHIDDNKLNPCLSNLQPLTPQANRLKAVASGMDEQYHPEWGKTGSSAFNAGFQAGYAQALKDFNDQGKNFHC